MTGFGPRTDGEREIFAVEKFRVDMQHRIQTVMNRKGVNQKQLAVRMGISEARVSQIFSAKSNVTARFVARVFFALGDECWIDSHELTDARIEREARLAVSPIKRWSMPEVDASEFQSHAA